MYNGSSGAYALGLLFIIMQHGRYDALVSRYEEPERRRDGVVEQISQIMIRSRKIERFIEGVKEDLPELITEFDESLWSRLVDSMTVYSKDRIVWKLTCGMEIEC